MSTSSTVISFDIGIKNLAYCILQNDTAMTQIHDWNVINLMTMPSWYTSLGKILYKNSRTARL